MNRVLFLATLVATILTAQVQSGRIVGTVTDPNGAVVPSAQISITATSTNQTQTLRTSGIGDYVVTGLNPGFYAVRVSMKGFQTTSVNNVEIVVGQSVRVDVALRLGETTTTVEVTTTAPLLDTESGTLGHVITNKQIVDLPLNGRSFYELARLLPGGALLPGGGNLLRIRANYISGTAISGVGGSQTTFQLDGVDVTDHHQGGTNINTSIDALQEFKVQQSAYSAEFSNAGGMLNATTKSGTNSFHGSLFEFLRNDKLDARDFFARQREVLKRNQFGGTIGGPLSLPGYSGKDKQFFFFAYEGMRERQGLVFNNIVPSAAMKTGDFSRAGLPRIFDPLSLAGGARTQFPGNIIPASRIPAQAIFFNKFIPTPNSGATNFVSAPARVLDTDQITSRFDRRITDKHQFFARYSYHINRQNDPNSFPELGYAPLQTNAHNVVGSLSSNLRPTVLHELRYNYMPMIVDLIAFQQGVDINGQAGVRGFEETRRPGVLGAFPDFSWSGYASMNGSAFDQRPKTQSLVVHEITDNLTWIKGRHIFKFGGKFRYWQPLFTDSKQHVGQFTYNGANTQNPASPGGTGDAFADHVLGLPRQVTRAFPADTFGGQARYWHFYAHDDVKLGRKLTLNIGLRYEYSPWLSGYRNQLGTFDGTNAKPLIIASPTDQIDASSNFAVPSSYALFRDQIRTSSQAGLPLSITATDRNQWAPRIGLAWRPFGENTVLRGGYGLFYEVESSGNRVNNNVVPFKLDETAFNDAAIPIRTLGNFFLGTPLSSTAAPSLGAALTQARMGNDQHWNFGVQRQLSANTVVEVDYVGNKGSFLAATNAVNIPPAGAGAIQVRRPYPRYGGINYFTQDASSTYHALQTKLEQRHSKGLFYLVSYTWSKATRFANTPAVGGNTAWERALAGFDIPHNLAMSSGWELPFGKGKKFLTNSNRVADVLLGGWTTQGILVVRSGRPFTPTVTRDISNNGIGGQRPNRIGSGKLESPTLDNWFDKNAFTIPANFTYGNSGGGILREDRFRSLDFSIFKQFQVTEGTRLQFRAEFFNLTNTASFLAPNPNIDVAAGGRVTSTSNTPRQIQFALKYAF